MDELVEVIGQLQHKEIAAFPAAVLVGVRLWRQFGGPWPKGNLWGTLITSGLSLGTSLLGGIFWLGLAPQAAMAAVIPTVLAAIGAHHATKAVGSVVREPVEAEAPKTSLGRTIDIIVPAPVVGKPTSEDIKKAVR